VSEAVSKGTSISPGVQVLIRALSIGLLALLGLSLVRSPIVSLDDAAPQILALILLFLVPVVFCERAGSSKQIYGLAFFAFHIGLLAAVVLQGRSAVPESINSHWLFTSAVGPVLTQVTFGAMALLIGFLAPDLYLNRRRRQKDRRGRFVEMLIDPQAQLRVGLTLYGIGLAFVLTQLVLGGFQFTDGYMAYWDAVQGNSLIGYGFLLVAVGAGLVASIPDKPVIPWLLVGVVFVLFMPAGVRSAALFPAAVVVAARSRHENFKPVPSLFGVIGLLGVISIVQGSRLQGIRGLASELNFSPVGALAEMGSSIVSVYAANVLVETGRQYWYGQSFVVVPLRYLENAFFGGAPAPQNDYRFLNQEIVAIFGPIGGSPVAEGVRNGGLVGVVIVMTIIGIILAWTDTRSSGGFLWGFFHWWEKPRLHQ